LRANPGQVEGGLVLNGQHWKATPSGYSR
jgi:hypothetical protein